VIVLKRSEHPISRRQIDSGALRVLSRLYRAGHTAYLVGGSVRDLFLERTPKDFDIVTSARPTQVRKLFRNCRLIGRRFRLAHVHFSGSEIVEVATFRCQPEATTDNDLLLITDNRFGSPEEDAYRRDFTINGLFYNIADYSVIDYVGGVSDIEKGVVRTINDPWTRFQEDPVRMIRAIKFAAKLNFKIEKKTWKALQESASAISKSPVPRVQEEIARLLEEGSSSAAIALLYESGLLEQIEPNLHNYLASPDGYSTWDPDGELLFDLLAVADRFNGEGRKVSRSIYFSLWLLPFVLAKGFLDASTPDSLVRKEAERVLPAVGISRRDMERVGQVLLAVRRFRTAKKGKRTAPRAFLAKSYLDEALLLYEIFLEALEEDTEHLDWWHDQKDEFAKAKPSASPRDSRDSRPSSGGGGGRSSRARRFRKRSTP
jgi:poly(A) polymerase